MKGSTFLFGLAFALLALHAEKPKKPKKKRKSPKLPLTTSDATTAHTIRPIDAPRVPTTQPTTQQSPASIPTAPTSKPSSEEARQKREVFQQKIEHFINTLQSAALRMKKAREIEQKRTKFPYNFQGPDRAQFEAKALREYRAFLEGTLPKENYPISPWAVGEDFQILKMSPVRWVEVKFEQPQPLSEVIASYAPSWETVTLLGAGLVIAVAPEVLVYLGLDSAAALTSVQILAIASKITAVIKAGLQSTGAGVAELAAQLYFIKIPGGPFSLGSLIENQLKALGIRVLVRGAISK